MSAAENRERRRRRTGEEDWNRNARDQEWDRSYGRDYEGFNRGFYNPEYDYVYEREPEGGYDLRREYRDQYRQDYGEAWGYGYDEPVYWTYEEVWLIPGPYTGVGPRDYRRQDERIFEEVCDRLSRHGQLDASDIEVEIEDGEVTLKGTVDSRRAKRMAEDTAESVFGVSDVHNRLRIRQPEWQQRIEEQRFETPESSRE